MNKTKKAERLLPELPLALTRALDELVDAGELGTLSVLSQLIPWKGFRDRLRSALEVPEGSGEPEHKRCDEVLMFKILVLCELFALSNERAERKIADRLSFML